MVRNIRPPHTLKKEKSSCVPKQIISSWPRRSSLWLAEGEHPPGLPLPDRLRLHPGGREQGRRQGPGGHGRGAEGDPQRGGLSGGHRHRRGRPVRRAGAFVRGRRGRGRRGPAEKKGPVTVVIDFVAGTFQPHHPGPVRRRHAQGADGPAGGVQRHRLGLPDLRHLQLLCRRGLLLPAGDDRLLRSPEAQVQPHPGRRGGRHHDAPHLDLDGRCGGAGSLL